MRINFIQNIIDLLKQASTMKEDLFELNLTINANKQYEFKHLEDFKGTAITDANSLLAENLQYLFPQLKFLEYNQQNLNNADNYFIWGTHSYSRKINIAKKAVFYNKPIYTLEMGFLYSASNFHNLKIENKYRTCISYTIDNVVPYYDARYASNLEQMLNDKNLIITKEQKERARNCINKIIETHLTKYNHQPIFEPNIGRKGAKKVLVVDQSYGDMSISKGWASDFTFQQMLDCAIKENPGADIIVKTHPDTMTSKHSGYYTDLKAHDNIYTQTEPINPISLIKYVDKVYVCTTQFGFEALMCGKEVRVFGMPFYAGWGLSKDEQICERRTNTRSLEEIFYITYILYSHYVNPETKQICELEEAMEYLLNLREEFFNKYLVK